MKIRRGCYKQHDPLHFAFWMTQEEIEKPNNYVLLESRKRTHQL